MSGALRVLEKELFELLHGFRGILLALVLPSALLLLVGQLRSQPPKYRLLVAGKPADDSDSKTFEETLQLFRQLSMLEVIERDTPVVDPLTMMRSGRFDLLVNVGEGLNSRWEWYTAESDPSRLANLQQIVTGLQRMLHSPNGGKGTENTKPAENAKATDAHTGGSANANGGGNLETLATRMGAMGAFPSSSLFPLYPDASSRTFSLLPRTVALIICFLPFVLTASSLLRERESRMLDALLAAPQLRPISLLAGKCLFALVVTLFDFLLMLVLAQSFYHLYMKPGLLETIGVFILPALFSSAFVGFAVSSVVRSQSQAILSSALWLLLLTLFSGFLFPIAEASKPLQWLSRLSPLTFVQPVMNAWMFGAGHAATSDKVLLWLLVQAVAYGGFALCTFYYWLRSV